MNLRRIAAVVAFALGITLSAASQAATQTWDIENAVFADGGTISGSFTFNTATDTYISWNFTTTATTNFGVDGGAQFSLNGATYTTNSQNPNLLTVNNINNLRGGVFENVGNTNRLGLGFVDALNSGLTTIALNNTSEINGFNSRVGLTSGDIKLSAVPLPGSLLMFGAAMVALFGFATTKSRRLQRQAA